ncbi:hypothetical protein [Clostridium uliginosum]|uniref:Uncharacterized protein n=1 Tax=Clostridium uliginosum TaxID=119641 RepID=A0A1I1IS61_9CLOT|nr:hypothetical protein [Clostridium uliginosum]SFC37148.1 hypothetical protein SAMN05421842_1031 [Clostridium uliginosum]
MNKLVEGSDEDLRARREKEGQKVAPSIGYKFYIEVKINEKF